MRPLEVDVEGVAVVARLRRPASRGASASSADEQRVGGVGLGLVGEVEPRRDPVQQAAREHRDVDVRRLAPPTAPGLAA